MPESGSFREANALQSLDYIEAGDVYGCWQDIDAGVLPGSGRHHSGIAKVVVQMEGYNEPYLQGMALVKRICAIPRMIKALRMIAQCENIYDCKHLAREVLQDLGVDDAKSLDA